MCNTNIDYSDEKYKKSSPYYNGKFFSYYINKFIRSKGGYSKAFDAANNQILSTKTGIKYGYLMENSQAQILIDNITFLSASLSYFGYNIFIENNDMWLCTRAGSNYYYIEVTSYPWKLNTSHGGQQSNKIILTAF